MRAPWLHDVGAAVGQRAPTVVAGARLVNVVCELGEFSGHGGRCHPAAQPLQRSDRVRRPAMRDQPVRRFGHKRDGTNRQQWHGQTVEGGQAPGGQRAEHEDHQQAGGLADAGEGEQDAAYRRVTGVNTGGRNDGN